MNLGPEDRRFFFGIHLGFPIGEPQKTTRTSRCTVLSMCHEGVNWGSGIQTLDWGFWMAMMLCGWVVSFLGWIGCKHP